ncbi:uncharacterized protein LOC103704993 [Phoenix dactylifera]|uniref:Uncharacterized protein LOC103704993 n=1 Tax=Phoenix dactylifera TaxID=42345 RepID=A0A8B7BWE6_PHODC|nr:uncharacterized protein LOC103704993 [Phoenix dactylifera]XP_008786767.1 uncharacterized protein LOC103704993 [Phoenix dactylifera]
MAFGAKEIIVYIRRTSYIFVCDHPFIIGMVFFVLILYSFFPSLFVFLVSSSPVIVCTAILLGTILIYGEPNIPEVEKEDRKTQRLSPLKVGAVANLEGRRETREMAVRDAALGNGRASVGSEAVAQNERYARGDSSMAERSVVDEDKKENYGKKVSEVKKIHGHGIAKKKEASSEKLAAGGPKAGKDIGSATTSNQRKAKDPKKGVDMPTSDNGLVSSLGSPWHHVDHHDASSGSELDQAESSSPDAASMSDIMPMLDELHPLLLDSEAPHPALLSKDNSDAASIGFSDDGSAEEEAENQDDEDDEEGQEKDDETKPVVTWTEDDQKNLVELGKSELERNRRLENVIAKQRARKLMEKNLIDLDSNDSLPSIEELSRFQIQIPTVFAPRRNPFDLPYDADEIPGSAPSRLLPRQNPFDLPYEQPHVTGNSIVENLSQQEVVTNQQRDMLFRRHESFTSGALFLGDLTQERHTFRFKPYFVAERTDTEETGFADDQRESSEESDLKSSSKSDAISLVTEQESHKELPEEELHRESDSIAYHDAENSELESQSSEADSVDVEKLQSGISPSDDHSRVMEEAHQAAEVFGEVGEETSEELEPNAIISDAEKAEVIEEKYESGSSTSSGENVKSTKASVNEQAASMEKTRGISPTVSVGSSESVTANSDIQSREAEQIDDSQVAEPVYDSSPSAIEKTQSNVSALDEALFGAGKEGYNSHDSSTSDMQANVSLVGSPPRTAERNASLGESTGQELASAGQVFWIASSLASVEENESRSREISEIRERDVIGDDLYGVHDDLVHPILPILPKASSERWLHRSSLSSRRSSLSSVGTESSEGSLNVSVRASCIDGEVTKEAEKEQ